MSFFDEVYCFSPLEKIDIFMYGMHVIPTTPRQFSSRIQELEIDLVRAYGGYWACDMVCENKVEGVPVVVSVHDKRESWLYNSIRDADHVLVVSNIVKELVISKGVPPERIHYLPNRVNLSVFKSILDRKSEEEFKSLYPGKYRILHVGRKSEEKNLDTLIGALARLGPDYACIFVGKDYSDRYRKLSEQCGVIQQCYFVESVPNAELAKYYSFCDCMCTPSKSEGFGIVFIEALACESVVVTSDIAPMNEYITNDVSGILVKDFENPTAIAEAVTQACTNQSLRNTIQSNARKTAEPFNKERIDQLEVNLYKRFIKYADDSKTNLQEAESKIAQQMYDGISLRGVTKPVLRLCDKNVHIMSRKHISSNVTKSQEYSEKNIRYVRMKQMLKSSKKIIDLGCGNNPVEGATVAVDYCVEPKQRSLGHGAPIDENIFRQRNIEFINQRIDVKLPFADKEFDFAYSHHVFEHLDDPATACKEMIRIAKAGVIITPSVFAEIAFGRPYHKWLVIDRNNAILFLEKRSGEYRQFGDHPEWDQDKGWITTERTNPFDMVLNESGWYREISCDAFNRLRQRLRWHWFSHSSVIEVIFSWQGSFNYQVVREQRNNSRFIGSKSIDEVKQVTG